MLLALSFPRFGHPAFAWIALVPLLVALTGWRGREGRLPGVRPTRAFALGLVSGMVFFVGTIYWTGAVLRTFGGLAAPLALLGMVLLALYLALFPAVSALVTARLIQQAGLLGLWLSPAAWVGTEFLRGYLFGGFPWVPLGNSQVTVLPVAQLASVVGVYGLSALVALVSAALAQTLVTQGRLRAMPAIGAVVFVLAVGAWGASRIADGQLTREGTPLRIGLVQGNVAQEDKWRPEAARQIFTTHLAMTRDLVRRGAEYVVWPESSTPFMFEEDEAGGQAVRALARELGVPILLGSEQLVRAEQTRLYNAAFLLTPDGETAAVYHKIHLVPFGEYVPFKQWLYFVSPLVERLVEFSPGDAVVLLPVGSSLTSTAICYEVVFPSLIRRSVLAGSQLLTTITNDAWYGDSSAPYQHFAMASMRAIEQGRYLARAANTGISGVVDPYGRVVEDAGVFVQAGLVSEVRLLTDRTVYSVLGDAVAYGSLALIVAGLVVMRRR